MACARCSRVRGFRILLLLVACLVAFSGIALSEDQEGTYPKLTLKFTGGMRYMAIGDMNTHLNSLNAYYRGIYAGYAKYETSGQIGAFDNWSGDWSVEVGIAVSRRVRFGLETWFFRKANAGTFYAYHLPAGWDREGRVVPYVDYFQITQKPDIKVIMPLGLNFYYSIYSSAGLNIFIKPGIDWYSARMKEAGLSKFVFPGELIWIDTDYHWTAEDKFSLGFHAALVLEYSVAKNCAVVAELEGRYVRLRNFKGTVAYARYFGPVDLTSQSGTLRFLKFIEGRYYFDYYELNIVPLPYEPPQSLEMIRNAVLNLSGYSLRIGIRLGIF